MQRYNQPLTTQNAQQIRLSVKIAHYFTVLVISLGLFAPPIHQLLHADHIDRSCKEGHSSSNHFETNLGELDCDACAIGKKKGLEDNSKSQVSLDVLSKFYSDYRSPKSLQILDVNQRGPPKA